MTNVAFYYVIFSHSWREFRRIKSSRWGNEKKEKTQERFYRRLNIIDGISRKYHYQYQQRDGYYVLFSHALFRHRFYLQSCI